jgi:hypothetical protein
MRLNTLPPSGAKRRRAFRFDKLRIVKRILTLLASIPLFAQDPQIFVYREQIRPGKLAKYMQVEEDAARFCAKAPCPNPYLALTSMTGPNEAWWINGFDTAETFEKIQQAYAASAEITQYLNTVDGNKADLAFGATRLLARFHPEMSFYSTPVAPRYFTVSIVQVRLKNVAAFRELRSRFKQTLERVGKPQWVYQVTSGTDDVTFIVMTPARTMQDVQTMPVTDDSADIIAHSETRLYAVSPALSMPAESWMEADPDFWKRP